MAQKLLFKFTTRVVFFGLCDEIRAAHLPATIPAYHGRESIRILNADRPTCNNGVPNAVLYRSL